jgi:hypothetical protein
MPRKTAVSKYLAQIGRKGGKASGKARMEKLTPEQRQAVAKTAATARWGKPVTQAELQQQAELQDAEWTVDRMAQLGAEDIDARVAAGAEVEPGQLSFDTENKKATPAKKGTAGTSVTKPPAKKSRPKSSAKGT